MSKRHINNAKNSDFTYMVVFAVVMFYGYFRNYIISRIGVSGSAYLFTSMDFIAIFIALIPYSLMIVLTNLIKSRLKANQKPNARRIIYGGMVTSLILSLLVIAFVFLFRNIISDGLLSKNYCSITLVLFAASILPLSCSAVYKSFFNAARYTGTLLIIEVVEKIILIFSAIIACKFAINYGTNASNVLHNKEVLYAFGAIGCAAGFLVASIISAIIACVIFRLYKSTLNDEYYTGRQDDIYDIFSLINNELYKISGPMIFTIISIILPLSLYISSLKAHNSLSVVSYNVGLFSGPFLALMLMPVFWIIIVSNNDKNLISKANKTNDLSELRVKALDMINYSLIISIGTALFIEVCVDKLFKGLMFVSSSKAVLLTRVTAPVIVFLCLALTFTAFLQGIKKPLAAIGNSLLSMIIAILAAIILIKVANLGIVGVIAAIYIYSGLFMLLNLKSLNNFFKHKTLIKTGLIRILISGVITSIIILAVTLLLGFILLPVFIALIDVILFILIDYILLIKLSVLNGHTISKYPFYGFFHHIGKLFHII